MTDIAQTDSFFTHLGLVLKQRRSGMNEYLHIFTNIYTTVL